MADVGLKGVTKTFPGSVLAVSDLTLQVEHGQFAVLLGPSGCGKSTTLRLIAGLEEPDQGEILIGGEVVNHLPPQKRDLAMVFQSYALYPHMSVAQNMGFGLKMRRVPAAEIRDRVRTAARLLGLEEFLERYPNQLSGGQKQRVALGRAIVREPAVFLLDEPLSNLDAQLRTETRVELLKLQRQLNGTFILVTHDQVEAMMLADVIAVMKDGTLQQTGTPEEIYGKPANLFVAGFVGSPPMNLFPGDLLHEDGAWHFRGEFSVTPPHLNQGQPAREENLPVVLGFRPEAARISPAGHIRLRTELVENRGGQRFIYGSANGGQRLSVAAAPDSSIRAGEIVSVSVNPEQLFFFDAATGKRIGPETA
ncbi:MAG: sn-glycerol-3-phosphate ABC transporter ATP-binding protein UgpC [Acidobacteriota bacterium]|nr:sn-glycerol-3-phosphate ABC transporter ATP-binding protein UgpC [Acidobacteriota bacterium]